MDNKKLTYKELEQKLAFYEAMCDAWSSVATKYQKIIEIYEKRLS